jgi:hypothetical protein
MTGSNQSSNDPRALGEAGVKITRDEAFSVCDELEELLGRDPRDVEQAVGARTR